VQCRQLLDSLVDNQPRQVVRKIDLPGLKALPGELHAGAMGNTEQFKAGLEHLVRIGGKR
jgi:hypothetical protein